MSAVNEATIVLTAIELQRRAQDLPRRALPAEIDRVRILHERRKHSQRTMCSALPDLVLGGLAVFLGHALWAVLLAVRFLMSPQMAVTGAGG